MVLFELLTSKKLFLDTSEMGVLKKVQNGEIISPREINKDIDEALEKIILKSLNKTCDKRYQSAAAMIADLETFMVKKYNYMPGPVQLSHFIYHLFEKEIIRDGIKVDLKPLPEKPLLREIPKAQPEPPQPPKPPKPLPVQESKVIQPAAPLAMPSPPPPVSSQAELRIDFDEDKIIPVKKKATAAPKEIKKTAPLFKESSEEKKKKPAWAIALVLIIMAAAALVYFLVLKKPAAGGESGRGQAVRCGKNRCPDPSSSKATAGRGSPGAGSRETEAGRGIEETASGRRCEDAAQKKKLQDEKRAKQVESERLKKEEADRLAAGGARSPAKRRSAEKTG